MVYPESVLPRYGVAGYWLFLPYHVGCLIVRALNSCSGFAP